MVKKTWLVVIIVIISLIPFSYAAHYITGVVENSLDGNIEGLANGKEITLWKSSVGINNNLTDVIGPTGKSGTNNIYLMDCEMLTGGCNVGDVLTLQILDSGNGYPSEQRNITVTGAGYDIVNNITINSPPKVKPIYPEQQGNISNPSVLFNCSLEDLDNNLVNVTLFGNWSGIWHENETKTVSGNQKYVTFLKNITQGKYEYWCRTFDNASIKNDSLNYTFTVDLTKPVINSILINQSYTCGNQQVRVNCTATDEILGVNKVIIQEISPSGIQNYSTSFLSENTWYSDIFIDEIGNWKFNCIVNDSAGNKQNLTSKEINGASPLPDLYINYTTIYLDDPYPIENQTVMINASIENLGCGEATESLIGFFEGNPNSGGYNIGNFTITIPGLESKESKITWFAEMGFHNFFVYADYWENIIEYNETNNQANKSFSIKAWQEIYGNVSVERIIGTNTRNFERWQNLSYFNGNIFIADSESDIDWLSLQALGRTKIGEPSSNDFSELDSILNMQSFEDSISNKYTLSQIPKSTQTFYIHGENITNVPIINSTGNTNFITGILWDSSDDINLNGEYDSGDQEDIVFVGKIIQEEQGAYGKYDYEITIPARLREYKTQNSNQVYLYYDLS